MSTTPSRELRIGIIGGSGLGDALGTEDGRQVTPDTPFGPPSSPITLTAWQGVEIALLQRHGIGHTIPPTSVPYRANIYALKDLGCTHVIASGATGSLREDIAPGDLVIADQVIDKTTQRVSTFYEKAAVHVEFAQPFCPVMRKWLLAAAEKLEDADGFEGRIHRAGTYVCMEGPAFSTRAESEMHRQWGGDLIGMTVMPEAKLAREAELAYALIALPTDYDCWRPHDPNVPQMELLKEIIGNLKKASAAGIALMKQALRDVAILRDQPSPAHEALTLGIWSDKSKLDPREIDRLRVLWGRHFS
jgi:5'-methylthioadenosine phosphorylase